MNRLDAHAEYPENYVAGLLHHARETGATSVVVPMVSVRRLWMLLWAICSRKTLMGTGTRPTREYVFGDVGALSVSRGKS